MNLKRLATDDRYIGLHGLVCGIVGISTDAVLRHVGLVHIAERAGLIVASALLFIAVSKRLLRFPWFWCLVVALITINAVLAVVVLPGKDFPPFITWPILLAELMILIWLGSHIRSADER